MARPSPIVVVRICCAIGVLWAGFPVDSRAEDPPPVFETDIQSLLRAKCGKCHSEQTRKGSLDLSSVDGLRRGGESGETLTVDSLDDNPLWTLVEAGEMPPEGEPRITAEQQELIRRWIAAGARSLVPEAQAKRTLTQHDVIPILLLRCTTCHGPRLKQGELDLRTPASMLAGGVSGPALVPGDPDASLMIRRIESEACPPGDQLLKFFVRRPSSSEVETLRSWIAAGAPTADIAPDVATHAPDALVTDEDRKHWAFQPPRRSSRASCIDDFVANRLADHGLEFSPEADRETLIRRAYHDLIGMPPSVAEFQRWCGDDSPRWYTVMLDHLLASPRYGERWGRYWLDLAGYADSEGGTSADPLRGVAWKYRDYVIDAFNRDKPYDRFLLEQIAGDELIDYQHAPQITQQMVDNLIATGFLRMGIDETGSRTMNFVPERLKVISDAITVVSSGVMGLTMECARCHSHKYDPIPHRDYYRLKAVFQGALDEHDWSSFKTRTLSVATPEHRRRVATVNPPLEREIKKLTAVQKQLATDIHLDLLRYHFPEQPEFENQATLVALKKADNNRTLPQKILVERLQNAEQLPDQSQPSSVLEKRQRREEVQREIDLIRRRMAPSVAIRALWDLGRPSPSYVLRRGEHDKPGPLVGPGVPSVLTDGKTPLRIEAPFPGGTSKTGRRLALARWLIQPNHPLTARVMVNRIWYHHFGSGLAADLENFGVAAELPSHPKLLDWLALEFIDRGWSVKQMHRQIMNSRTYRQSSRITENRRRIDPTNRLLSRMPLRRMDAESLRDSLLFVAGKLDAAPGGIPDTVSVNRDGLVSANPTAGGGWRRSVYLQYRRTEIPTMMDTFDYPQMGPNCISRNVSTVSPQSLLLMNNRHIRDLAVAMARRVRRLTPNGSDGAESHRELVRSVYRIALSRPPSEHELSIGIKTLAELEHQWQDENDRPLETYCHVILNSAAFLYVD
jgi:hypothetical protein